MDEVEEEVILVTKKLASEALSRVVLKSPVDTGQFRANWNVSFGSQDETTTTDTDKAGAATIAKGIAKINGLKNPQVIWVSNSLDYANRLENGWSQQAPMGMVALTFAELQQIARVV
jgi:hypothetical protein